LIRETFDYTFTFEHSGLARGKYKEQLAAFAESLADAGYKDVSVPVNWMDAFGQLRNLIRESKDQRKIIFIDELSWMDTARSDLMTSLENFWNGFASARKDVVLIVVFTIELLIKLRFSRLICTNVKNYLKVKVSKWIGTTSLKVTWPWVGFRITGITFRAGKA